MEPQGPSLAERIRGVENALTPLLILHSDNSERVPLQARMDFYRVPGVSLAVIKDYQLEWARGYGVKETGKPEPVTVDTLFQAGSISKPLTAVAALHLVEGGVLDLDEDVNKFLVSWKVPRNGPWAPRVTLRQLLSSHTSGLTVETYAGYPRNRELPNLLQVLDGTMPANSIPVRVNMIPGIQYRYSSGGYAALQQLLMDVVGLSFPELMQELVLGPLGMDHSTFQQPLPDAWQPYAATGHRKDCEPVAGKWLVYPEMATGGLWSTPYDLAKFVTELLRVGAGIADGILSTAMMREMLSEQVNIPVGLGIFLKKDGEAPGFSHVGNNEGFYSKLVGYCQSGVGAVVMTNWHYSFLTDELLMAVASEYHWPGHSRQMHPPVQIDAMMLASYAGDYELAPGHVLTITRKHDTLYLCSSGQMEVELYSLSETEFYAKVVNAIVVFQQTGQGRVTGLLLRQDAREQVAKKVG